jgi:hypothetical protein
VTSLPTSKVYLSIVVVAEVHVKSFSYATWLQVGLEKFETVQGQNNYHLAVKSDEDLETHNSAPGGEID